MNMRRLQDLRHSRIEAGSVLCFPVEEASGDTLCFMLVDLGDSGLSFIEATGYRAGTIAVKLPVESYFDNGRAIAAEWLIANWESRIYGLCDAEHVRVISQFPVPDLPLEVPHAIDITPAVKEAYYNRFAWEGTENSRFLRDFFEMSINHKVDWHSGGTDVALLYENDVLIAVIHMKVPIAFVLRNKLAAVLPVLKKYRVQYVLFDEFEKRNFIGEWRLIDSMLNCNLIPPYANGDLISVSDFCYHC